MGRRCTSHTPHTPIPNFSGERAPQNLFSFLELKIASLLHFECYFGKFVYVYGLEIYIRIVSVLNL